MTAAQQKAEFIVLDIIKQTSHWNIDMWYDFRNVFIPNYYELRSHPNRILFNEWKIKQITKYNRLLIQK